MNRARPNANEKLNDHFVARDSREFPTCAAAEAYLASTGFWSDPILVTNASEADKFQRKHPLRDAAQNGRIAYKK